MSWFGPGLGAIMVGSEYVMEELEDVVELGYVVVGSGLRYVMVEPGYVMVGLGYVMVGLGDVMVGSAYAVV